jgi:hypothetical protein
MLTRRGNSLAIRFERRMRRKVTATLWIARSAVPLLVTAALLVGCCVLPFHRVMHELLPLGGMAAAMRGIHHDDGHDHDAEPATPARQREEPAKRLATLLRHSTSVLMAVGLEPPAAPRVEAAYRSFMSLGAIRCDQDVGLNVLDQTFRI